jgi:hypothetical protein
VWGPFDEPEQEDDLDLEAVQGSADVAEASSEVLLPLLPFQKQFLAWGIKQVSVFETDSVSTPSKGRTNVAGNRQDAGMLHFG